MTTPYKYQMLPMEKVFRDPVHNYIHVQHQVILDLINSAEVQRLRRIKQLGTSSFTFHGAEHSRFSHSLGVYEITRRICDIFQRNYSDILHNVVFNMFIIPIFKIIFNHI